MNTFFSHFQFNVANVHSSSGGSSLIETVGKECAILPFILAYKSFRRAPNLLHLKYVISSPTLWRSCYQTRFFLPYSLCPSVSLLLTNAAHTHVKWHNFLLVFSTAKWIFVVICFFFVRFFFWSLLFSHFPHCFIAILHDGWFNGLT